MNTYSLTDSSQTPLDHKLDKLFGQKRGGFYIELGAHDGLTQSNTAFFEFNRDWKGVLIEPSSNQYELCKKNRPNSVCFNMACVSDTYLEPCIDGNFDGTLMASVGGIRNNPNNISVKIEANTLSHILDSISVDVIDLLSLDTEGYELNVLKGLNLTKYRPRYMLIEVYARDYTSIVEFLKENNYSLHSNFSNYTYQNSPIWDGTHNDYLFVDNAI